MNIEQFVERITSDPGLAERLRADPEATLRSFGITPTAELVEAVTGSPGSEELAPRISKAYRSGR